MQDSLRPFMFDKGEHDPQVVACTARPGTLQLTLECVCFQTRMKAAPAPNLRRRNQVCLPLIRDRRELTTCFMAVTAAGNSL